MIEFQIRRVKKTFQSQRTQDYICKKKTSCRYECFGDLERFDFTSLPWLIGAFDLVWNRCMAEKQAGENL